MRLISGLEKDQGGRRPRVNSKIERVFASLRIDVFIAATESCSFQQRVKKWKRKEGKREEKREEYIYTLRDIEWKDNGGKKGGEWEHLLATITSA